MRTVRTPWRRFCAQCGRHSCWVRSRSVCPGGVDARLTRGQTGPKTTARPWPANSSALSSRRPRFRRRDRGRQASTVPSFPCLSHPTVPLSRVCRLIKPRPSRLKPRRPSSKNEASNHTRPTTTWTTPPPPPHLPSLPPSHTGHRPTGAARVPARAVGLAEKKRSNAMRASPCVSAASA